MDINEAFAQQNKRKKKSKVVVPKTMSVDDYLLDESAPRPYSENVKKKAVSPNIARKDEDSCNKSKHAKKEKGRVANKKDEIHAPSNPHRVMGYGMEGVLYSSISGVRRKIIDVVFSFCQQNGKNETPPLSFKRLVSLCQSSENTVKVSRKRLIDSELLKTERPSNVQSRGVGACLIYKLSSELFRELKGGEES